MICAYDRVYLAQARETLGAMQDYAVWDCKLNADEYFSLFVTSGLADRFGRGDPKLVSGMSGVEIVWETFAKTHYTEERPRPRYNLNRSKDYWVGWALAHCQWATSLSFRERRRCGQRSRLAGFERLRARPAHLVADSALGGLLPRDDEARRSYREIRGRRERNGLYITRILEEEMTADDLRL